MASTATESTLSTDVTAVLDGRLEADLLRQKSKEALRIRAHRDADLELLRILHLLEIADDLVAGPVLRAA